MAKPDWEAIESAYRAGVLSLRDIGEKYGVTEGAIRKRAKKLGWVRSGGGRRFAKMVRKKKSAYQQKACHYWPYTKGTQPKTEATRIRNRYAECVPIPRLTHSNPVTSRH